jgi:hypothetical protein
MTKCIHCDFDEPFDLQHPINDDKDILEYGDNHWLMIIIPCHKYMAIDYRNGNLEFKNYHGNLTALQCPKCKQLTFQ